MHVAFIFVGVALLVIIWTIYLIRNAMDDSDEDDY